MKYTNAQIQCVCDIGLHSAHVRGFKLCGPICKLEIDRAVSAPPAAAGQKAHKARFSKHKTPEFVLCQTKQFVTNISAAWAFSCSKLSERKENALCLKEGMLFTTRPNICNS